MKIFFLVLLLLSACSSEVSVSNVLLNQNHATLFVGATLDLEAIIIPQDATNHTVSWNSNRPEIATVDANGRVSAIAAGRATITVTTQDGGKTEACEVTVNQRQVGVSSITLDHTEKTLQAGEILSLTATVLPEDATNSSLQWTSNNPEVATVVDGLVTAVRHGVAIITASSTDGSNRSAACRITVPRAEQYRVIITGYMPDWRITNTTPPESLPFLQIPDRVFFFHLYPDPQGNWVVRSNTLPRLAIVRAAMREDQELFITVGGGGQTVTSSMHAMGNDPALREAYATSLVNFAHQHNFDGIDMNWETNWSASPPHHVNRENFADLITRVRSKMNALPENTTVKKLIATKGVGDRNVELAVAVNNLVDEFHIMIYDEYGTQAQGFPHAPFDMYTREL